MKPRTGALAGIAIGAFLLLAALLQGLTVSAGQSLGDVNCDGSANSIDAALILQFDTGILGSLPCADGADVSGDGSINSLDSAVILQFSAGLLDMLGPVDQLMMVRVADGYTSVDQLANADVCVLAGTTSELRLADRLPTAPSVSFEDRDELQEAFIAERCEGWFGDAEQLVERRSTYPEDAGGPKSLALLFP